MLKVLVRRNHPVLRSDGLLAVFLTEPSLEQWRKHSAVALEEEGLTKRLDKVEEMSIPSDLEDKLKCVEIAVFPTRFLIYYSGSCGVA